MLPVDAPGPGSVTRPYLTLGGSQYQPQELQRRGSRCGSDNLNEFLEARWQGFILREARVGSIWKRLVSELP